MTCIHRGKVHATTKSQSGRPQVIYDCSALKLCTEEDEGFKFLGTVNAIGVCTGCPLYKESAASEFWKVDVVITSHNYGRYLEQAINSVYSQGNRVLGGLIVVDDASDESDKTKEICQRRKIKYVRTEFKSPHLARMHGLSLCKSPLVMFLDADNYLEAGYLSSAAGLFGSVDGVAIVYPDLQYFGKSSILVKHPDVFDMRKLESENFIDTGSVWLAEAVRQQFSQSGEPSGLEDWRIAKQIMRSGKWKAIKNPVPLNYRKHESNRLESGVYGKSYYDRAGLSDETVTVFTTFSGRLQKNPDLWEKRKSWLRSQTWKSIRLVVANTSHEPMPSGWDSDLPAFDGVSVYNHNVATPGLEDKDRSGSRKVEEDVSTAVASIYNRMWKETSTEFVLVLEDDVFPKRTDAIHQLMIGFDKDVCAVTGKYRQRYYPYACTYWSSESSAKLRHQSPDEGFKDIVGAGFGCIMLRRSHMADDVIVANSDISRYYDVDIFNRMSKKGMKARVNFAVDCDHDGPKMPEPPMPVDKLSILMTTTCRPTFARAFRSVVSQMEEHDDLILVVDGKVSRDVKRLWCDSSPKGRLVELEGGPHGDWGHTPRNLTLPTIGSGYVINFDDDDEIPNGTLKKVREEIKKSPGDFLMFQMRRNDGSIIPVKESVEQGNVGTPMFIFPHNSKLGKFAPVYAGDFSFISETIALNPEKKLRWIPEVIIDIKPADKVTMGLGLGDAVEVALTSVGITKERVSNWLGRPCKCPAYQEKLNKIGAWTAGVAKGVYANAKAAIEEIIP